MAGGIARYATEDRAASGCVNFQKRLSRTKDTVASIAQAWENVVLLVESLIERREIDALMDGFYFDEEELE